MARTGAVFGGEHSAHYYFRYNRYVGSGEINSTVGDPAGRVAAVHAAFAERIVAVDELDGLTLELADGCWFNVRSSNTESLLRLNVEGPSESAMIVIRDEALAIIRADD